MRKLQKNLPIFLALVLVLPVLGYAIWPSQSSMLNPSNQEFSVSELPKNMQGIWKNKVPYIDSDLINAEGIARVILVIDSNANLSQIASYMISCRVTPSIGGIRLVLGTINTDNLEFLASNTATYAILKDKEINFVNSIWSRNDFRKNLEPFKPSEEIPTEPSETTHNVTMREVVKIINATGVWTSYGVTGQDVTIAIIDTGVDYGSLGLGYWDVMARDLFGYPAAFDADAVCLVYTNITLTAFSNASGTFIPTSGLDPLVYCPIFGYPPAVNFSMLFGDVFPSDMNVTGVLAVGQSCHWGVMFQWLFGMDMFPVLVIDSNDDGIHDTVYVDISFDWYWIPYWYNQTYGEVWPFWSASWPPDYSFADENPITFASPVGARDFTGDGIYDISVSSLGYFLDGYGMSPNSNDRGLILQPIDPYGNYTCFVYDFYGHGTACASSAAGRDFGHPLFGYGPAYNAKIMGVTTLFMGDIIEGELWAAGFDLIPGTEGWNSIPGYGTTYGVWTYTGYHKADIISNSWGLSDWAFTSWLYQTPWYDVLTMLEDALTIPGYLDPSYPGTIIVHAGGNGGSGYGTFTEPGYSTLAIGVGASTSMNWTQLYFGFAGGYYDDVISWSARGPTALGTVKPDVLGIGAYGFAPTAVFQGMGNGANAYWLFGGTSMATPVVAGAAALVVQGFRVANGFTPSNEIVRVILKSTAVDLGYDPFLQGVGRVDCYRAVSLAMNQQGVVVASNATWSNVLDMIQISAMMNYDLSNGLIPPYQPATVLDTSWFAGTVKPGESTTANFMVFNPTAGSVNVNVSSVIHKQIGSTMLIEGLTGALPSDWELWGWTWGNITILDKSLIPENADFMTISLVFPYDYFDPERDYVWNQGLGIMVQDWNDTNSDGTVNVDEVWLINHGYCLGTTNEVTVGFPRSKFKYTPIIFVYQGNNTGYPLEPVPFKLYIRFYERVQWDWIELSPSNFIVPSVSIVNFTATLTVPSNTPQGVYEGQIMVDVAGRKLAVPVSVNVLTVVPAGKLVYNIATPEYDGLYNPFTVKGYFDWTWRYEAGDWKNWLFEFTDPSTVAAFVYADWEGNMTDVDMFGIHPFGIIMDGTGDYWMGGGMFLQNTRTGSTEEYIVLYTGPVPEAPPMPKLYTVLLHNVLLDGSVFPESLSCSVKMINVKPAPPVQFAIPAGESKTLTFKLSTGVNLTNVAFYPYAPFPTQVTPNNVSKIPEMSSFTFNVTVQVPANTTLGRYTGVIYLTASEFPPNVYIPIFIQIDVPTLETVEVAMDVGEIHLPGEIAQLYVQTSHEGLPISLGENIPVKLWYRVANGTFLSLNFNVSLLDTGLYTAEFEVPVDATSCCLVAYVEEYINDTNTLYRGIAMKSFDISSTLTDWNAYIERIYGDTAIIKTDVNTIKLNLTSINATITGLITNSKNEIIAVINTAIGTIQADLDNLNATLKTIDGTTVRIETALGEIAGTIESIDGDTAIIKTDVGTIKVSVENIEGDVKTVKDTTSQTFPGTWASVALSLIAAVCSATLLALMCRKKKSSVASGET